MRALHIRPFSWAWVCFFLFSLAFVMCTSSLVSGSLSLPSPLGHRTGPGFTYWPHSLNFVFLVVVVVVVVIEVEGEIVLKSVRYLIPPFLQQPSQSPPGAEHLLPQYKGAKSQDVTSMFDYAGVAVEIWHQILLSVIDLPYLLDTLIDREIEDWRNSARYHDLEAYGLHERQRRMLRLVCHSWRDFVDGYKYRWISYDSTSTENVWRHGEALEAIQSITASLVNPEGPAVTSRPRRIVFYVETDKDMDLYQNAVDYCSSKATAFFVKCADGYEDRIFEYMINQGSKLPMLRCLELPAPKELSNPLLSISAAFPKLIVFEINSLSPYTLQDGDAIVLQELEILAINVSALSPESLRKFHLPEMIHLSTPIGRISQESAQMRPIKSLGANLTLLNIYKVHSPICLPLEFWTWCPRLIEFLSFFSWIYLDTPAPATHPLKYIVHWPDYDDINNPLADGAHGIETPVILHSLRLLPSRVEVVVFWDTWSAYLDVLRNRYSRSERESILCRIRDICEQKLIRVEDQERVALDEFLVSQGIIWEGRTS
jgi:hypothetical protein